ncbi:hypothetical protein [Streptomyces griseofuscus]|uniref:hypothetical protein n=1 Tax=Streptomyces griseofuscus TaxID=146922 RepID=UPI00382D0ADB
MITPLLALALMGTPAPAHADATKTDGKVGLTVTGHGLQVQQAGGWVDGHPKGARARLYTVYQGVRDELTGWKKATPESMGITKLSAVTWHLKGRKFPQGSWLCIQFADTDGAPCAQIHR